MVIVGLLAVIGYPKVGGADGQDDLRSARTTVINLVATARAASVQTNRRTWIKFEGNKAYVLARPRPKARAGTADTVGTVQDLPSAQYGVSPREWGRFDPVRSAWLRRHLGDTSSVTCSRATATPRR